jgi:hypothetical protein
MGWVWDLLRIRSAFSLLLLVVIPSQAARRDGRPGEARSMAGAALLAACVALWYLKLWWDLRRVRRDIVALLTN